MENLLYQSFDVFMDLPVMRLVHRSLSPVKQGISLKRTSAAGLVHLIDREAVSRPEAEQVASWTNEAMYNSFFFCLSSFRKTAFRSGFYLPAV